jgi:hypothetical protein
MLRVLKLRFGCIVYRNEVDEGRMELDCVMANESPANRAIVT